MNVLQKGASRVQYTQKVTLSMWFSFAISAAAKMEVMYTENQYTENQTYMSIILSLPIIYFLVALYSKLDSAINCIVNTQKFLVSASARG